MNEYSIQVEARRSGIFSDDVVKGTDVVSADNAEEALKIFREKWKSEMLASLNRGFPISIVNISKI